MFKKADILLAATLIAAGLAISYIFSFGQSAGNTLEISCDGEIFGSYSLEKDREITINCGEHINKVIINKGTVSMSFSDCPGQDCIQQEAISHTGETIVCLPNRILLEISGNTRQYDTIAR